METTTYVQRFFRSITFKFCLVGVISLLLLIPAQWVKSLIKEREQRGSEVLAEISSRWGNEQKVAGPWLTLPYKVYSEDEGKHIVTIHRLHVLPTELDIETKLLPEERHRGIFKVIVYQASVNITGRFEKPDISSFGLNPGDILWDKAYLTMGITDMRGIRNDVELDWQGTSPAIIPGIQDDDLVKSGFHCYVPVENGLPDPVTFTTHLDLNGTKTFRTFPLGRKTHVDMQSKWPDPGFTGAFLPADSQIGENGFTASWMITQLNRNYPQIWSDSHYSISDSDFGVELINPVGHYQQSYRSVKYALMFIGLTFLLFMLVEILNRKRLHPVQYVLTGIALIIFYSLLVSLSEHLGFSLAYLISSVAVILLISYYIHSSLGSFKYALFTGGVLSALYIFLYIILRMQDYALLFGSVGLFVVLGLFMVLTRKINWYRE